MCNAEYLINILSIKNILKIRNCGLKNLSFKNISGMPDWGCPSKFPSKKYLNKYHILLYPQIQDPHRVGK